MPLPAQVQQSLMLSQHQELEQLRLAVTLEPINWRLLKEAWQEPQPS